MAPDVKPVVIHIELLRVRFPLSPLVNIVGLIIFFLSNTVILCFPVRCLFHSGRGAKVLVCTFTYFTLDLSRNVTSSHIVIFLQMFYMLPLCLICVYEHMLLACIFYVCFFVCFFFWVNESSFRDKQFTTAALN